jgi:F-type H+-transporting ATPase subunit c
VDSMTIIAVASIVIAGITTGFGTMGPALAEGKAVATALSSLAQQPDVLRGRERVDVRWS